MKPPNIVTVHFLSTKWSKKLFTINHYEPQNSKCIVTQELSAYELRAYYYNGRDMLELVRYQKENLQKAVGCEEVVFSCEEMLREERKRRRVLGKLAELPIYRIPYPQIRKIANFKGHIYGL